MGKHDVLQTKHGQQRDHQDKGVGRHNKQATGLLQPPQIGPTHQRQQQQREAGLMGQQPWKQGAQGLGRRHQTHRGGQGVIHQQCRRRHQPRPGAEVLAGDHIGASPLGVGLNRLAIGEHHNRDQADDADRDRQGQTKGTAAGQEQDPQGGLRRIGHRGEGIRGEDRQRNQARQALRIRFPARQRTPQKTTGKRKHPCGARLASPCPDLPLLAAHGPCHDKDTPSRGVHALEPQRPTGTTGAAGVGQA
jgi:hypothetical protein